MQQPTAIDLRGPAQRPIEVNAQSSGRLPPG